MADEKLLSTDTYIAAEDLSSYQFHFVKLDANEQVALINSDAESVRALYVLQNNPAAGEEAFVSFHGVTKIVTGAAALAIGTKVKAEWVGAADNGKAIIADTDLQYVNGEIVKASTAEDELAEMQQVHYTLNIT